MSDRAITLVSFTLAGALLVAIGELAAALAPAGAVLVLASVAFGASLLRAIGSAGATLGTPLVVVTAIAVGTRRIEPISHALGFAAGGAWAVLLSSVLWPVWTLFPLRMALVSTWRALADYVRALDDAVRHGLPPHDPRWADLARTHQRFVRAEIDAATSAALALRARRSGESTLGSNLVALLGSAEAQLRLVIALAYEIESTSVQERRSTAGALLESLASTYEWTARALSRTVLSEVRPADPVSVRARQTAGPLARRLLDASSAAAKVAAAPGSATPPGSSALPSTVGRALSDDIRALRDALSLRSSYLRHAVRVTIAVIIAQATGQLVSPEHVAWVTVTTVAVLQPYPGVTINRAIERGLGTLLGGIVALVVIVFVRSPIVLTFLLVPFGVAAVATRPRSHRLFVFFLTPLFVLLAERWQGDWWTAAARVGDAFAGATIALLAALVFPSREQPRLVDALRKVVDSVRRYGDAVIDAHVRGRSGAPDVLEARRDVAAAFGTAETSLERALSEPLRSRGHRTEDALMLLTYARRLANAFTSLDVAHASSVDENEAFAVLRYLHAVHDSVLHRRQAPAPPELDRSRPSYELLARIVRQAELVGSRRLPPRLLPSHERRGLMWAKPKPRKMSAR